MSDGYESFPCGQCDDHQDDENANESYDEFLRNKQDYEERLTSSSMNSL